MKLLVGIPNLVVVILMIIVLNPGIISIIIALTITGWIGMARVVRAQVLKFKNQEFVLAARTLGAFEWENYFETYNSELVWCHYYQYNVYNSKCNFL